MKSARNLQIALWSMLLTIACIQACTTLGYENVDTLRKGIVVANAEIRAANLLLQDLVARDAIDDESAQRALQGLRAGHLALRDAHQAVAVAGDPLAGETALERANTALSLAITILSSFTGEVT